MNDEQKIAEWVRWYSAAQPSYKAHALQAVYVNERALFADVVRALGLTLEGLMAHMLPDQTEEARPMRFRRKHK